MPRQSAKSQISEPEAFSQRLNAALVASDIVVSATAVQREFNALSPQAPVSAHAVRKWILGESIPTQQRLQVLAAWLKVTPNWLRFGDDSEDIGGNATTVDEQMLLQSFRRLPLRERKKLLALVQTMAQGRGKR
jgi:transcriptional regulator with XRE-family HTH domain